MTNSAYYKQGYLTVSTLLTKSHFPVKDNNVHFILGDDSVANF